MNPSRGDEFRQLAEMLACLTTVIALVEDMAYTMLTRLPGGFAANRQICDQLGKIREQITSGPEVKLRAIARGLD